MSLANTLSRILTHPHSDNLHIAAGSIAAGSKAAGSKVAGSRAAASKVAGSRAAGSKSKNKSRKAPVIDITDTDEESNSSHKDSEAPEDAAEDSEVELS
jgi:hypothetical protein